MTWKLIRSAMHLDNKHPKIDHLEINGTKIDNADLIAESFNNYFINIANDLANKLQDPPCPFEDYLPPSNLNSMGLTLTTPEELLNIGRNLKKNHTKGIDGIDPYIATPRPGSTVLGALC